MIEIEGYFNSISNKPAANRTFKQLELDVGAVVKCSGVAWQDIRAEQVNKQKLNPENIIKAIPLDPTEPLKIVANGAEFNFVGAKICCLNSRICY